ncbi:hypothetical protein GCM10023184_46980 [Flaviaesturariibacter amylovorans]|uniref:Uncharacterized protein n=1 Tax=Flaviaesturariibacter amylovorans TaxID=1084520 RepID=A0ABP8HV31_9BACT
MEQEVKGMGREVPEEAAARPGRVKAPGFARAGYEAGVRGSSSTRVAVRERPMAPASSSSFTLRKPGWARR